MKKGWEREIEKERGRESEKRNKDSETEVGRKTYIYI